MKKIVYFVICTFVLALSTSCEEDRVVYDTNNGVSAVMFDQEGSNLRLNLADDTTLSTLIQVNVTTISDVDRAITLTPTYPGNVDISSYFTIDPTTLVIPAGSYNGYVKVTGNYDNIAPASYKLVRFTLDGIEGGIVSSYKYKYDLTISKI